MKTHTITFRYSTEVHNKLEELQRTMTETSYMRQTPSMSKVIRSAILSYDPRGSGGNVRQRTGAGNVRQTHRR